MATSQATTAEITTLRWSVTELSSEDDGLKSCFMYTLSLLKLCSVVDKNQDQDISLTALSVLKDLELALLGFDGKIPSNEVLKVL